VNEDAVIAAAVAGVGATIAVAVPPPVVTGDVNTVGLSVKL
jgi:hypothetical protein